MFVLYCNSIIMLCCVVAGLVQCGALTPALWDFQKLPPAPRALLMLPRLWDEDSPLVAHVPTRLLHWVISVPSHSPFISFSFFLSSFCQFSLLLSFSSLNVCRGYQGAVHFLGGGGGYLP